MRDVHTDELLVSSLQWSCFRDPMIFGVAVSSFVLDDLDAQTVSLLE